MMRILAVALAAAIAGAPVFAAPADDWPCVQRKVPHLSVGQMWAGPSLEGLGDWRADPEVAALAPVLAVRRTPMEVAEARVKRFADGLDEEEAQRRLPLLFAGVFDLVERERTKIISGIGRYARKQAALAERVDEERAELAELEAVESPSNDQLDRIEALEDAIRWDTRVFDERRDSLTYVCEAPVIMERRLFALARAIMNEL